MAELEPPVQSPTQASAGEKQQLEDLIARATERYAIKDYSEASDLYSKATELQAQINGEMSNENAELLFLYGRSLYQVGVSKSDVLGDKPATEPQVEGAKKPKPKVEGQPSSVPLTADEESRVAEEVVAGAVEGKDGMQHGPEESGKPDKPDKPYFQFTGDETFEDSDEEEQEDAAEEGDGEEGEAALEEEDDLKAAWDVLDLARLHFDRKLEELNDGKGKVAGESKETRHVLERLADSHDLLAEISLEGEKFPDAANDFKASLKLKQELYPQESSLIAEAHYKLSLALEFAALTVSATENGQEAAKDIQFDEAGRDEAAKQMEAAIQSVKSRVSKEEAILKKMVSEPETKDEKQTITQESIDDVKDMIADMEQRLTDLRAPPVSIEAATTGPAGAPDGSNPLSGILGSLLGESPVEQRTRLEEATKSANDLTGLVRRNKETTGDVKKRTETVHRAENGINGNGKRKADSLSDTRDANTGKKARVEDVPDEE
ncbi:MAG: hypothetical protein M1833_005820 [Piccolia ochrophora]|nr:MAG: hypothetical protein M1833_005820 [Piccolia ochrophora]